MSKRKETRLDARKVFSPEQIRVNLLLSSLYLTAFEILKISIIEGTKGYFIEDEIEELTKEQEKVLKELGEQEQVLKELGEETVKWFRESYLNQVTNYEKEIGVSIENRDLHGLIPSCEWLQKADVLTAAEVEEIKAIKEHRNEIAHELPNLLVGEGFEVNLNHFQRIRELLHKIDTFWTRSTLLFSIDTMEEADMSEASDDELLSGREAMLHLITNTVVDYLNQPSSLSE